MENHEKNIDDLFREELGGYTETPPPAVWDSLQKKLAKAPQGPRWADRRIWSAAILCLLLILSIPAVHELTNPASSGNKTLATNETNTVATATNDGATAAKNKAPNNTPGNSDQAGNNTNATSAQPAENTTPKSTGNNTATNITATTADKTNRTPGSINAESKSAKPVQSTSGKKGQTGSASVTKTQSQIKHRSGGNNSNTVNNAIAGSSADNGAAQPEHIYNSSLSKPAPSEETASEPATATSQPKENAANVATKPQPANNNQPTNNKPANKTAPKKMPKPEFNRWEAGVKAGYELGFDNDAAKKAVVSPYLQYNLSPKFSIMTQPAFKYSSLDTRRIGNSTNYYKENGDSSVTPNGAPVPIPITIGGGFVDTLYKTNYTYKQSHDSIIKSNSIGSSYFEAELPILLKYRVSKNFSVYGGVNLIYSKSISIIENTAYYKNIKVIDSYSVFSREIATPPPASSVITYQGTDISQYRGPQYPTTTTDEWRVGYMLGFSYEFYKRWLFDALIQQSNVNPNIQAGYNVNTALSAPYFRFTLGYKLTK